MIVLNLRNSRSAWSVLCGVPQGSVTRSAGVRVRTLHTAELSEVIVCHGLNVHQYADCPHGNGSEFDLTWCE